METEGVKSRILITDDDRVIRKICQKTLEPAGYALGMAENGQQALELIDKEPYDLILTDMEMPVMDGMTLLSRLAERDDAPPVIMFTAHAYVPHAVAALGKGAYDFITKPFMTDALLAAVRRCLEASRLRKEAVRLGDALVRLGVLGEALARAADTGRIMQALLTQGCGALEADGGSILLYDESADQLVVKAAAGQFAENVLGQRLGPGERVAGQALKEDRLVVLQGPLEKDPRFAGVEAHQDIRSSMTAPMAAGGRPVGVICVKRVSSARPFSPTDEQAFLLVARMAGPALAVALERDRAKRVRSEELRNPAAKG